MHAARGRITGRRVAIAVATYVLGWLVTALVFVVANGNGIEASADAGIPYYAVFAVLYGVMLGWWWLLVLPVLHFFAFEPVWNELTHEGPIHYAYDRPGYALAGTLGIAAGLALRTLYERTRFGSPSSEEG